MQDSTQAISRYLKVLKCEIHTRIIKVYVKITLPYKLRDIKLMGKRGVDPLGFKLSTRQTQAMFHVTSDLPRETDSGYPLDRTLPGTHCWFGYVRVEKKFLLLCSVGTSN